jgi:solute carrier family 38 (sodium-coupled neutral amino acid transporter), member 11
MSTAATEIFNNADPNNGSNNHIFRTAATTLTLGILGSSVLPVPWAFSRVGIAPAMAVALWVAFSNAYSGTVLLRAAAHLNKTTYESVCETAGGSRAWRFMAEVALILLLFGTLAGDAALLADTGSLTIADLTRGKSPDWAMHGGRLPMLFLIVVLVVPLSMFRQMRGLERAATAGVGLIMALMLIIVVQSLRAGLPAIRSGELPIWKVAASAEQLPEALSVLSFAFYTTPMLLPLLSELPRGPQSVDIMCGALQFVTLVIALLVYAVTGIFAAARWGLATEGDVLVNSWLPGKAAGILDLGMAVYLSISMAPMAITLRYLLDAALTAHGELAAYSFGRDMTITVGGISAATAVAAKWPEQAEKLFALTGATAVSLVSYILPVAVHFLLYFGARRGPRLPRVLQGGQGDPMRAWLLEDASMLEAGDDVGNDVAAPGVLPSQRRPTTTIGTTPATRRESSVLPAEVAQSCEAGRRDSRPPYPHVSDLRLLGWWQWAAALFLHIVVPSIVLVGGSVTGIMAVLLSVSKM